MNEEAHNLSLFNPSRGSLVLSKPGHVLSRMTLDLLPVAQQKRRNDDAEAEPSFQRGMEAYARKDFETALRELNYASELGHRLAQFELATMHLDGVAGSANHALAYHWFHRAAEQGDANSLNKLGWMCEAGFGVERDQTRAVNWFRQAAERGHLEAQFNLAAKYDNGEGVAQNHAEAARWYRLAAEQGLADARFFLAQALEVGEGLPKNIDEALDWYILASEQGHRSAKISLWGHALAGRYLPEDETEKIFIEVLGAELGHPLAEYKYGYRLMFGEGVTPNLELSCKFYQRAANRGFAPACEHLWSMYICGIKLPNSVSINPSWRLLKADSVYAEFESAVDVFGVRQFRC